MAYLIELLETGEKIIHQIEIGTYQIGRHLDSDIFVSHKTVSRYHAVIMVSPQTIIIKDCQSANGTYINRSKISTSLIKEGDSIELGLAKFSFTTINPPGYQYQLIDVDPTVISKPTFLIERNSSTNKIANSKDYKISSSHLQMIKKSTITLELILKLLSIREPEQMLRMIPSVVLMLIALF